MKTGSGKLSLKVAGIFLCCCQLWWKASSFWTRPKDWECSAEPVKHGFLSSCLLFSIFSLAECTTCSEKQMVARSFWVRNKLQGHCLWFPELTTKMPGGNRTLKGRGGVVFSHDAQHLLTCLLRVETQVQHQAQPVFYIHFYSPLCLSSSIYCIYSTSHA